MIKRITLLLLLSFTAPLLAQYTAAGSDSTIDIITWNIENFPKDGQNTIDEVAQIVSDLNVDAIAVQEIADTNAFNNLLAQLPGWDAQLSPHEYSGGDYQKVGLLFNTNVVTVNGYQLLFEDDSYAFPRPAMELDVIISEGAHTFDFKIIVVHLKAYEGEENEARRRAAIDSLKNYIDSQVAQNEEKDFILTGDFNDHLEDPPEDNVFTVMLDDTAHYEFLSEPLAGFYGTYIGYNEPNLIDHTIITDDARSEYGDNGYTEPLYLDYQNPDYETTVSDHRPLYSQFAFQNQSSKKIIPIADIHADFAQYNGQIVKVQGVITIGAGIFSPTYTSAYVQDESEAGLHIYCSDSVISDLQQCVLAEIKGQVIDYNGLHELDYQSHSIINGSHPLPETILISTQSINNTAENPGRWIEVTGEIESISDGPHINMQINDGSGSGKLYFDPDAGLDVSGFSVGDWIKITGVKTVYNYEGQAQPGYQSDIEKTNPSAITLSSKPENAAVLMSYPNPFNQSIKIVLSLPRQSEVRLLVFDLHGALVSQIANRRLAEGAHQFFWDGRNDRGEIISSGIYPIVLFINGDLKAGKLLRLLK